MKYLFEFSRVILIAIFIMLMGGCNKNENAISTLSSTTDPYLGEEPPGMEPKIFAPGIVSMEGTIEMGITFSPDGKEIYWCKTTSGEEGGYAIWYTRENDEGWSQPHVASFSMKSSVAPFMMNDNKRFLFFSFDPKDPDFRRGTYITERTGDSWSEPKFFHEGYPIICSTKGIFYCSTEDREETSRDIATFRLVNGEFTEPQDLAGGVNSENYDGHPTVAPDGSYILFDSRREDANSRSRMYVSFRNEDGSWGEAIKLGDKINEIHSVVPVISPDGKYIFFSREDDIWWVSTEIIEQLRGRFKQ